jgi:hypothetical protein
MHAARDPGPATPPRTTASSSALVEQLRVLSRLHSEGHLSDEEFRMAKGTLLGR